MSDPNIPNSASSSSVGANQLGQFLSLPYVHRAWEICSIWHYSPQSQTYTIVGGRSGPVHEVRRFVQDPGEVGILAVGTEVVVHYELGFPVISGVLKSVCTNAVELNPARMSEVRGVGGEDGVFDHTAPPSDSRPPNDPIDVLGDDWARKSKHNNKMGVLAGGTNIMSSSPMAQIRTHGINDMVEVMANVYRHISSLGNLEIVNNGGKTSLIWRAGTDQLTENGSNVDNWTLWLEAGAEGNLFSLKVTTPHNNTLCELHMSADGRLSLTGVAGVDISSGARGTSREDVAENKDVSVLGAMTTEVVGEVTEAYQASKSTLVAKNDTVSAGNDLKETVGHDRLTHISNKLVTTVEGGPATPPPDTGNLAILWDAVNGGIESVTGNPKNNASLSPKQSQNFVNYAGDFNFSIPTTAKFNLISQGDDSVLLAADAQVESTDKGHTFKNIKADSHVCKWEEWENMMEIFLQWCDDHVHLTAMGPSGPAKSSATGPASGKVTFEELKKVKSTRVRVGA